MNNFSPPEGRQNPFSDIGKTRIKLQSMAFNEPFESSEELRSIYRAAKEIGVKVKQCRMEGNKGWCYWKIKKTRKP